MDNHALLIPLSLLVIFASTKIMAEIFERKIGRTLGDYLSQFA